MKTLRYGLMVAVSTLAIGGSLAPVSADSINSTYSGILRHVSSDNIKVYDPRTRQTMGFMILPRYHNVFYNGRETQMTYLRPGQYVKVVYDRKFLGTPHADRIDVMNNSNAILRNQPS